MLKYIELKSGHNGNGPAWIARVKVSRSGRTVYFNGKALKRASGGGIAGNHYDIRSGQEYWVSGIKKNGLDRHWAGSGLVAIEAAAVPEYLNWSGPRNSMIPSSRSSMILRSQNRLRRSADAYVYRPAAEAAPPGKAYPASADA
jgi:hypothetical protein